MGYTTGRSGKHNLEGVKSSDPSLIYRLDMFEIEKIEIGGRSFQAMKSTLPENAPPLLLIKGAKGYVMCGYLNIEAAEKFGSAAAIVSGVKTFDDVLNATIKVVTTKAKQLGLEPGMVVKDVIAALG
jgi:uncharacterized protein YunC (DUF1805 family)